MKFDIEQKAKELAAAKAKLIENERLYEQCKGQLQMLEKTLKKEFKITPKQIPEKIKTLQDDLLKLEDSINVKWEEFNGFDI